MPWACASCSRRLAGCDGRGLAGSGGGGQQLPPPRKPLHLWFAPRTQGCDARSWKLTKFVDHANRARLTGWCSALRPGWQCRERALQGIQGACEDYHGLAASPGAGVSPASSARPGRAPAARLPAARRRAAAAPPRRPEESWPPAGQLSCALLEQPPAPCGSHSDVAAACARATDAGPAPTHCLRTQRRAPSRSEWRPAAGGQAGAAMSDHANGTDPGAPAQLVAVPAGAQPVDIMSQAAQLQAAEAIRLQVGRRRSAMICLQRARLVGLVQAAMGGQADAFRLIGTICSVACRRTPRRARPPAERAQPVLLTPPPCPCSPPHAALTT